MDSVDVVIPVVLNEYMDEYSRFRKRAIKSVYTQTAESGKAILDSSVDNIIRIHTTLGHTLAEARNKGASMAKGEWLIFLDADDALDPGYVEAMLAGSGDMRWPATLGFYDDGTEDAEIGHLAPNGASLLHHNWMVIGTMVRRDLFLEVGGFRDLPMLEDWDLWIRMVLAGAQPESCFDAIYRINVRPNSRNAPENHRQTYSEIQQRYQQEWYSKGLS